jgi:ParB family chromosome partitioning protein
MSAASTSLPVADIQVGARHRREMGDIVALAQNISDIGLLHPVVVTPGGQLIAGERRLLAYRHLGREHIPATVLDLDHIARGEYAENFFRKMFTPSESADIADALQPIEEAQAKERQGARIDIHQENFSESSGRALDRVAKVVGLSRPTIVKGPRGPRCSEGRSGALRQTGHRYGSDRPRRWPVQAAEDRPPGRGDTR